MQAPEKIPQNDEFLEGIDLASIADVEHAAANVLGSEEAVPAGTEFLTPLDRDRFVSLGSAACIQADDSKNDDATMWVWD